MPGIYTFPFHGRWHAICYTVVNQIDTAVPGKVGTEGVSLPLSATPVQATNTRCMIRYNRSYCEQQQWTTLVRTAIMVSGLQYMRKLDRLLLPLPRTLCRGAAVVQEYVRIIPVTPCCRTGPAVLYISISKKRKTPPTILQSY